MSSNRGGFQKHADEFLKQLEIKKLEFDVFIEEAQLKKVQLELDIEKIQEEKDHLKKSIKELSDKKAVLRVELDNTMKVKQDCKREAIDLAEAIDFQKHDLATLKNDISIAEKTKEQIRLLIESGEEENSSLTRQADQLRASAEVMKEHLKTLGQEETALESAKVLLDREIVEKNGELKRLEQEIFKLGEERQHESSMIQKYRDNCETVQKEFQQKTEEKEKLQQELNELSQQEIETQGRLDHLLINIKNSHKELEIEDERVRIKKDEYHVVVSDIEQEKEQIEAYRQESAAEMDALLDEKRSILLDVKELKEKMVSANEQWKDLKVSLCYDQEKAEKLAEENKNLEIVRGNLLGRIEEAEATVEKLNSRERELLPLLDQQHAQLEILKEQCERGEQKYRETEEKYVELTDKLKSADSLFVSMEDKINHSRKQLKETRADLIIVKKEKVDCLANVRNLRQQNQELHVRQSDLGKNIALMHEEEKRLIERVEKFNKKSVSLITRIESRRQMARDLKAWISDHETKKSQLLAETSDLEELKSEKIALKDKLFKEYRKKKQLSGQRDELRKELDSLLPNKLKLNEVKHKVKTLNKQLGKLVQKKMAEEMQISSYQEKIRLLKLELKELGGYRKKRNKDMKLAEKRLWRAKRKQKQQQAIKNAMLQKQKFSQKLYERFSNQREQWAGRWHKVAAVSACILLLALSPLWYPKITSDIKREVASVASTSYYDSYVENVIYSKSYIEYMANNSNVDQWKKQLLDFLSQKMALGESAVDRLVSIELAMISELKNATEHKIINKSVKETKEFQQIEKNYVLKIKAILGDDEKYMQFKEFQKEFFEKRL